MVKLINNKYISWPQKFGKYLQTNLFLIKNYNTCSQSLWKRFIIDTSRFLSNKIIMYSFLFSYFQFQKLPPAIFLTKNAKKNVWKSEIEILVQKTSRSSSTFPFRTDLRFSPLVAKARSRIRNCPKGSDIYVSRESLFRFCKSHIRERSFERNSFGYVIPREST